MQVVTFINYNAKHCRNTFRDLCSINSHIATRAGKRKAYEAEPCLLTSPLDFQIGGLRTDPFNMLPIKTTGEVLGAFDYRKRPSACHSYVSNTTDHLRYSNIRTAFTANGKHGDVPSPNVYLQYPPRFDVLLGTHFKNAYHAEYSPGAVQENNTCSLVPLEQRYQPTTATALVPRTRV